MRPIAREHGHVVPCLLQPSRVDLPDHTGPVDENFHGSPVRWLGQDDRRWRSLVGLHDTARIQWRAEVIVRHLLISFPRHDTIHAKRTGWTDSQNGLLT